MLESVSESEVLGRVLHSDTTGFCFGCRVPEAEVPIFGGLVKVAVQHGKSEVYGLITRIAVASDQMVLQLAANPNASEEYVQDQLQNRRMPIEVDVVAIGYRQSGHIYYHLPPQPPWSLSPVRLCDGDELRLFSGRFDYFPLILAARHAPVEDVLAAHTRQAAEVRGSESRAYLVDAGRELARLLNQDLLRLDGVLRRIRPVE